MEIGFFSYRLDWRERFYFQSVLFFLLVFGLALGGHIIVHADPSNRMSIDDSSKVPLSKRTFESSGQWRAPEKPKNKWRESEESNLTLEKDRIQKKKSSSLYDTSRPQDNYDPYARQGQHETLNRPAKLFEFRF